jgi:2'-5' RNA ligase
MAAESKGQNKNSYLCVSLPFEAVESLSTVATNIQALCDNATFLDEKVSFKPMRLEGIHMTFLFAGTVLHQLPVSVLTQWYEECSAAVSRYNKEKSILTFDHLELFPPGKLNLVVGLFQASNELHSLQHEIHDISVRLGIVKDSGSIQHEKFIPHVTLGKIIASKSVLGQIGQAIITNTSILEESESNQEPPEILNKNFRIIAPSGIDLRGVAPKQKWFDWNLYYTEE